MYQDKLNWMHAGAALTYILQFSKQVKNFEI